MANVSRAAVEELLRWGMVAIPTPPGEKNPGRKGWQKTRMGDVQLAAWTGEQGVFVNTGEASGWVVLDLDNTEAANLWRARLGDDLWYEAPRSLSSKGQHLWFRVAGAWQPFTQDNDPEAQAKGARYDLLADGRGVMAPPSLHPSGKRYRWAKKPYDGSPMAPEALQRATVVSGAAAPSSRDSQRGGRGGGHTRSLLSQKLANPPDEGGRNNWLTAVMGHLAKEIRFEDAFVELARALNRSLVQPLDDAEVVKTADSIWRSEAVNHGGLPTQRTGWLAGEDGKLWTLAKEKDDKVGHVEECGDFNLEVMGKYTDEEHRTTYRMRITSGLIPGEERYQVEQASTFGTGRTLDPWMAARELNWWPVPGDVGKEQAQPRRLRQYLSSQDAPVLQVAPHMGWHDPAEGFVAAEGLITAAGLDPQGGWLPDPAILRRDKHINRYGFEGSWEEAQRVLREVLTWQDPIVTNVFGAWWAACMIKAQLMPKIAGFPFMAIEAMSGSGKTTGFFGTMVQLSGVVRDQGNYTFATLRDALASNRSGIVWIDDPDDASRYYPLIRAATAEGSESKKDLNTHDTISFELVAPVLLTAEALPKVGDERALMDRLIQVDVPSAKERASRHGRATQWDDILALRAEHPDLWKLSGWYIQRAMQQQGLVGEWESLRPAGGRHGDKMGVLRIGARLLADLADDATVVERVDAWVAEQEEPSGDYLTNRILPDYLRQQGWPDSARYRQAAFIDEAGIVWWWPAGLSDWWLNQNRHSDARTRAFGEMDTLDRHRRAMGVTAADRKQFHVQGDGEKRTHKGFYPCPPEVSQRIIDRSHGA